MCIICWLFNEYFSPVYKNIKWPSDSLSSTFIQGKFGDITQYKGLLNYRLYRLNLTSFGIPYDHEDFERLKLSPFQYVRVNPSRFLRISDKFVAWRHTWRSCPLLGSKTQDVILGYAWMPHYWWQSDVETLRATAEDMADFAEKCIPAIETKPYSRGIVLYNSIEDIKLIDWFNDLLFVTYEVLSDCYSWDFTYSAVGLKDSTKQSPMYGFCQRFADLKGRVLKYPLDTLASLVYPTHVSKICCTPEDRGGKQLDMEFLLLFDSADEDLPTEFLHQFVNAIELFLYCNEYLFSNIYSLKLVGRDVFFE